MQRGKHLRNHRTHFSFKSVSLFKVLGIDTQCQLSLILQKEGFYITDICIEVVALASLCGQ